MIAEEVAAGIPTKRIVIGGFSQGGALALYSALTFPEPLAAVVALSAWLPLHQKFPAVRLISRYNDIFISFMMLSMSVVDGINYLQIAVGNKNVPVLQCHGDCDPMVPYKWGQMTSSLLKQFMTQTEFKTYRGMMHGSSDEVCSIDSKLIVHNLSFTLQTQSFRTKMLFFVENLI